MCKFGVFEKISIVVERVEVVFESFVNVQLACLWKSIER
jgi:hypothetical protein